MLKKTMHKTEKARSKTGKARSKNVMDAQNETQTNDRLGYHRPRPVGLDIQGTPKGKDLDLMVTILDEGLGISCAVYDDAMTPE